MAGADLGTAWLNVVPSFQGMKQKVESELGGVNISGATSSWGKQAGSNLAAGIGGALETIGKIGLGAVAASVGALTADASPYIFRNLSPLICGGLLWRCGVKNIRLLARRSSIRAN